MLLAGDQHVDGLVPTLRRLCTDSRVVLGVLRFREATIHPHFARGMLGERISTYRPTLILISWTCGFPIALELGHEARAAGASFAWLTPPEGCGPAISELAMAKVQAFRSDALALPLGPDALTPTVVGYAGWAGALWSWLGR